MGLSLPEVVRAEEKLHKFITAEQVLEEPKHFLKARLLEGGAGLGAPGQRGLEGQDW